MAPSSEICFGHQIPLSRSDTDYEEEEEEEFEGEEEEGMDEGEVTVSSPLMLPAAAARGGVSVVEMVAGALRRSLMLCSSSSREAAPEEDEAAATAAAGMQIGRPTDVRHVSHVTFDRFVGFLGLPADLEPDVPHPVPSASVSVFGVSPTSMQCSYDRRGNSVPTILLTMQRKLYYLGGLQAEGIFRINADNSQELYVRDQLNMGLVPDGVDLHCLAGLIKAWFRELPSGVLDSLTPEQVMHCNTEEECGGLASMLPPVEKALLDWTINLMADVVENKSYNKMNARNIAMVFAPNMTKMADPLTALIHAVQVMNFLKTLILKTVNEREEAATVVRAFPSNSGSPSDKDEPQTLEHLDMPFICSSQQRNVDSPIIDGAKLDQFLFRVEEVIHHDAQGSTGGPKNHDTSRGNEKSNGEISPLDANLSSQINRSANEFNNDNAEGLFDKFKLRKGVGRLCRHPVFQFSRSMKKSDEAGQACV
ncbi:rho GTPase-activating protein 5-like [Phragmites australis]|uniref:rho GTPase-activating protein 5-like n=1 Tax=Phragmites australis TaxID=29695 RepID=UPI002D768265|nr:rho GTPase-activating protein 5-like [Phragmites australis]